jgi:hypothetical protein
MDSFLITEFLFAVHNLKGWNEYKLFDDSLHFKVFKLPSGKS